jgi:hypothetical protein
LFLRAGVGIANSVVGAKDVEEDTPQDLGIRVIDKGVAYFGEVGYELRLPHNFAVGLKTTVHLFDIGGFFIDRASVVSTLIDFGMYF